MRRYSQHYPNRMIIATLIVNSTTAKKTKINQKVCKSICLYLLFLLQVLIELIGIPTTADIFLLLSFTCCQVLFSPLIVVV